MKWYKILLAFVTLIGAIHTLYQIFKMTELDTKCKRTIIYLIGRRKYPSAMPENDKKEMASRKNKDGVSHIFFTIGTIILK